MTDPIRTSRDSITLTGLRVFGHHGVLDEERRDGQDFLIDVTIALDLQPAAVTDDVRQTIHYGVLAEQIAEAVGTDPVDLIETVALRITELVLAFDIARSVTVTVHKPGAPIPLTFHDVSVTLTRDRG